MIFPERGRMYLQAVRAHSILFIIVRLRQSSQQYHIVSHWPKIQAMPQMEIVFILTFFVVATKTICMSIAQCTLRLYRSALYRPGNIISLIHTHTTHRHLSKAKFSMWLANALFNFIHFIWQRYEQSQYIIHKW